MNAPASDPMAGVDYARGVACNTRRPGILSVVLRPRSTTLCTLPAKPTLKMLTAASNAAGVSVATAAVVYASMTGKAGAP